MTASLNLSRMGKISWIFRGLERAQKGSLLTKNSNWNPALSEGQRGWILTDNNTFNKSKEARGYWLQRAALTERTLKARLTETEVKQLKISVSTSKLQSKTRMKTSRTKWGLVVIFLEIWTEAPQRVLPKSRLGKIMNKFKRSFLTVLPNRVSSRWQPFKKSKTKLFKIHLLPRSRSSRHLAW